MAIPVGTKAPDFNLKSKNANGLADVKLSNNFGKANTVLLFFPLAFTGVCTTEMCDLTAGLQQYKDLNAEVIGVSVDSPFSQEALQSADDRTSFYIRTHIGNHSLFLSGIFPQRIRYRAERKGFPDLQYYESLGQSSFRIASDHRLAQRYDLAPIYSTLAERFQETRQALNDISERLVCLGDLDAGLDKLILTSINEMGWS